MQPGVCFTVEPGLYDKTTGVGVRIEDVVIITKDGHRVLTAALPKERAAIEALRQEPGTLQTLELPR